MGKIIGYIFVEFFAGLLFYGAGRAAHPVLLFLAGLFTTLGAVIMFLYGLREFFLADMLKELRTLNEKK